VNRYWPLLTLLAAIWGAGYLFIKVALDDIEPAPMMAFRAVAAGLLLTGYLAATRGGGRALRDLLLHWKPAVVLGLLNATFPYWLVAWGEKYIDSSVAGIAQSTVPIFTFLLATHFLPHERVGAVRIAGVGLGLIGVVVLAGVHPGEDDGWWAVAGTLAVVLSSFMYAAGGVYGQLRVRTVPGPVLAAGSMLAGGLILLPAAALQPPDGVPGAEAIFALLALTVVGTVFAQLLLFRVLRLYGARRLSLVTYLIPAFAVFYGAVFLDEPVTVAALGGLALILAGVALASGARLLGARRATAQEEPA
jgi:drug/metabolite transporter (DMT)-like permease